MKRRHKKSQSIVAKIPSKELYDFSYNNIWKDEFSSEENVAMAYIISAYPLKEKIELTHIRTVKYLLTHEMETQNA